MRRIVIALIVVVILGGVAAGGLYLGRRSVKQAQAGGSSTKTTAVPRASTSWTGEYFWQTGPADAPTDAVLLTLLQSPSGVSGTWAETASSGVYPIGGPSIGGISPGGRGSVPVQGADVTAGTLSLTGTSAGTFQVTFQANNASAGLSLTYTPSGGGIETLNFDRVSSAQRYNQAVATIDQQEAGS